MARLLDPWTIPFIARPSSESRASTTYSEGLAMSLHSRKWGIYRAASVILGAAIVLWLVSFRVATAIFEPIAQATPVAPAQAHAGQMRLQVRAGSRSAMDAMRVRLEQLSEHELKLFYARCSQEGVDRRLDGGEAIACSMAYEVLLKTHFAGDFHNLLSWSRTSSMGR
jgi:hypothetical protein